MALAAFGCDTRAAAKPLRNLVQAAALPDYEARIRLLLARLPLAPDSCAQHESFQPLQSAHCACYNYVQPSLQFGSCWKKTRQEGCYVTWHLNDVTCS